MRQALLTGTNRGRDLLRHGSRSSARLL